MVFPVHRVVMLNVVKAETLRQRSDDLAVPFFGSAAKAHTIVERLKQIGFVRRRNYTMQKLLNADHLLPKIATQEAFAVPWFRVCFATEADADTAMAALRLGGEV
jgi:hypothetical protein